MTMSTEPTDTTEPTKPTESTDVPDDIGSTGPAELTGMSAQDELVADIEHTREQLGQTLDALTQKLDPKEQARRRIQRLKVGAANQVSATREHGRRLASQAADVVTDHRGKIRREYPVVAVSTAVAAFAAVLFWRKRR